MLALVKRLKARVVYSSSKKNVTATECHLPYGITDTGHLNPIDMTPVNAVHFNPATAKHASKATPFTYPGGMEG